MADTRSIVITLKLDKTEENQTDTSNQTSSSYGSQQNDNDSSAKTVAAWGAIQLATIAVNEITAWIDYEWNKTLSLDDDYIGQRNKQIATTQIGRAFSSISSIGNSAVSGFAMGGPLGAVIGGAVGLIGVISGTVRSNKQGEEQQKIQLRQMEAQLEFTRSRAGWSTHAASIGEDL